MRLLVCGGRNYDDQAHVDRVLDAVWAECRGALTIIHGQASGADACANAWALAKRAAGAAVGTDTYGAEWGRYGPAAGPRRNQRMIDEGRPDRAVAFPGGRGTADMVRRLRAYRIPVEEVAP